MKVTERVGFIGVGAMGRPMAARVAAAGFPLTVLDADAQKAGAVAKELGAGLAASGAELAGGAELIVTMLPTSAAVAAALSGEGGVLAGLRPGAIIVEMSSGVPAETKALAALVSAAGGRLIDAPVSGGVVRAVTGELAIMAGGDPEAIARAEPLLRAMGATIMRTGAVGSAHAMKALNNLVSAGGFLLGIEALLIGQAFGLDPAVMVDVLNASTGMSNSSQRKFKQFVLSRSFDAGFGLDLMVKDLGIAMGVARETGTPAPMAALVREMWAAAQAMLGPGQDHTAAARLSERLAGRELG
ncbi:MAG: NAD(P)-dependent oxidoreductase [Acetobacteraceae bacterium]|nr:NAD(P)-dependent oxidoreductase [Acetobacteraceae bacterium]